MRRYMEMGKLKHKLLFCLLTISAYISPLLMVLSLWTSWWLLTDERTIIPKDLDTTQLLPSTTTILNQITTTIKREPTTTYNSFFPPTFYVHANYGLWQFCRITDRRGSVRFCEYIKYFHGSDSENNLTDSIKGEIGKCLITFLFAFILMAISILIHTYAMIKGKVQYLFLISGCLFIFAGLASLTGLVIFIAAVNGAVDSKLTLNSSKEEEPVFQYYYGISFYCAVCSFLCQELNGICNIYWYMGHYRRHKLQKLSDLATEHHKVKFDESSMVSGKNTQHNYVHKPSIAKISQALLDSSILPDENDEYEDINNHKTPSLIKNDRRISNFGIKREPKQYISSFKNLSKMNNKNKPIIKIIKADNLPRNNKTIDGESLQDNMILKDIKLNNPKIIDDSASITETETRSSTSPSSGTSSSSPSSDETPSDIESSPSHQSSFANHQTFQICPHSIKIVPNKLNESFDKSQIKHISIEDDELKAKFYKLNLDEQINKIENHNRSILNCKMSNSKSHSLFFRDNDYHYLVQNQNPMSSELNEKQKNYLRHITSQPYCIHNQKLKTCRSNYNLNSNDINNKPSCLLHTPTLSPKDICSTKSVIENDYPVLYSGNPQEINIKHGIDSNQQYSANKKNYLQRREKSSDRMYQRHHGRYPNETTNFPQNFTQSTNQPNTNSMNDISNTIKTNNTNYIDIDNHFKFNQVTFRNDPNFYRYKNNQNNSIENDIKYFNPTLSYVNYKSKINQRALNDIASKERNLPMYKIPDYNENYSQLLRNNKDNYQIPIIKQNKQPVSLTMVNAANAAAQATNNYMNYNLINENYNNYTYNNQNNISVDVNNPNIPPSFNSYYMSNTLPNLFNPSENYGNSKNYMKYEDMSRGTGDQHRINRRINYEISKRNNENVYDYMPVTKLVENNESNVYDKSEICHRQSRSASMQTKLNVKRTTSV